VLHAARLSAGDGLSVERGQASFNRDAASLKRRFRAIANADRAFVASSCKSERAVFP
jgi:hypothetical protein